MTMCIIANAEKGEVSVLNSRVYTRIQNAPFYFRKTVINLAVVACLDRVKETLIMLKSALLQTKAPLHFHIFADDTNQPKFKNEVRLLLT